MERIEDLCLSGTSAEYRDVTAYGRRYDSCWLPSLPLPMFGLRYRLSDAWLVLTGRATAVQWPHQRKAEAQP